MDMNNYLSTKRQTFEQSHKNLLFALSTHALLARTFSGKDFEDYYRMADSQAFEICVDSFWKWMRAHIEMALGVKNVESSPKGVAQRAFTHALISQEELSMFTAMVDDRNLNSHKYAEVSAEEIHRQINAYADFMDKVFTSISSRA